LTYDAASIAQRLLNTLEAIGRLTGQLRAAGITINNSVAGTVNNQTLVMGSPEVVKVQSAIIRALAPFPEARACVIEALSALEPAAEVSAPSVPKSAQAYEPEVLVKVREWISPALASPDLVLGTQPPTQPHSCVVVERPIRVPERLRTLLPRSTRND
jgi:hypothetical protein